MGVLLEQSTAPVRYSGFFRYWGFFLAGRNEKETVMERQRTTFTAMAVATITTTAVLFGGLWATESAAATKSRAQREADKLVVAALQYEINGSRPQREEALDEAFRSSPDHPAASWHSGFIEEDDLWLRWDEVPKIAKENERLDMYRRVRGEYAATIEGRLQLAGWCADHKLIDQQRAHLVEVLAISPDHLGARSLLGYQKIDGSWFTAEEIRQSVVRTEEVIAGLQEWRPKLEAIRTKLRGRSGRQRDLALEELEAIDDVAALPAIELVFCGDTQEMARLGVETIDRIPSHEAAVSLCRQAVFSPWPKVAQSAIDRLKSRDMHTYVPALLSSMPSLIQSRTELYVAPRGRVYCRHVFSIEKATHRELAVFDTLYNPTILVEPGY